MGWGTACSRTTFAPVAGMTAGAPKRSSCAPTAPRKLASSPVLDAAAASSVNSPSCCWLRGLSRFRCPPRAGSCGRWRPAEAAGEAGAAQRPELPRGKPRGARRPRCEQGATAVAARRDRGRGAGGAQRLRPQQLRPLILQGRRRGSCVCRSRLGFVPGQVAASILVRSPVVVPARDRLRATAPTASRPISLEGQPAAVARASTGIAALCYHVMCRQIPWDDSPAAEERLLLLLQQAWARRAPPHGCAQRIEPLLEHGAPPSGRSEATTSSAGGSVGACGASGSALTGRLSSGR
jgi:hypothetical protein